VEVTVAFVTFQAMPILHRFPACYPRRYQKRIASLRISACDDLAQARRELPESDSP